MKIISIFYGVANELGLMESVYRRAMVIALREAGMASEAEVAIPVWFRGQQVGIFYADFVVQQTVILELKASDEMTKGFEAQLLHYLRATKIELGYVLAFGERARFKRVAMSNERKSASLRSYPHYSCTYRSYPRCTLFEELHGSVDCFGSGWDSAEP